MTTAQASAPVRRRTSGLERTRRKEAALLVMPSLLPILVLSVAPGLTDIHPYETRNEPPRKETTMKRSWASIVAGLTVAALALTACGTTEPEATGGPTGSPGRRQPVVEDARPQQADGHRQSEQ